MAAVVPLHRGGVSARVLADEGGALVELTIDGRPVLTSTPWAPPATAPEAPAVGEADWVARWRGGWQLCFPTAGQPDPTARIPQSFHGTASQTRWTITEQTEESVRLRWSDEQGITADREWRLTEQGAAARTTVTNAGSHSRRLGIAEHLILGGDVLSGPLTIEVPPDSGLQALDYAGLPLGSPVSWPGETSERWGILDASTPARVCGIISPEPRRIAVHGSHGSATVCWRGDALTHALLWEELGVSTDPPWNGRVRALGIEPSTAPHGAGLAHPEGAVTLDPDARLEWSVDLTIAWTSGTRQRADAA
jgi:hypothetical protein